MIKLKGTVNCKFFRLRWLRRTMLMKYQITRILLTSLLLCHAIAVSQPEVSKWAFGNKAGLDFITIPPSVMSTSILSTEGNASIADLSGNFLFYTTGNQIWHKNHGLMANGTGLFGQPSTVQSSLIIKKMASNQEYYVFTLDDFPSTKGLCYSIVDMSLAAGLGSVTAKNVTVNPVQLTEKMAGVRHCNGIDVWLIVHEVGNNNFLSYLVSASGISSLPVVSSVGAVINTSTTSPTARSLIKISPTGKKLVSGGMFGTPTELFDFDNSTGVISNPVQLTNESVFHGVEFSSDGSKVYAVTSQTKICQWDLCAGNAQAIQNSKFLVDSTTSAYRGMQLGPDGRIYISGLTILSAITNPNSAGNQCQFQSMAVNYGNKTVFSGLPNFVAGDIKAPFSYTTDLGCPTVSFTAPSTAIASLAPCPSVGKQPTSISWNFGDPASGAANTSSLAMPIHTYPSAGTYTVRMVVNYTNCVPDTLYKFITVYTPTISIHTVSATCSGLGSASVTISGPLGPLSYQWLPGGQISPAVHNLSTGQYTVTVGKPGAMCTIVQTVNVTAPLKITASLFSGSVSCSSASAQAVINNGSGNYTYTWMPGGQNTKTITGLSAGIYTLSYTDTLNNCTGSSTISVQLPVPDITVAGNFTVCPNTSVTLTAFGADAYRWSSGSTTASMTAQPTVNTIYTVTGNFTGNGCSTSKTVSVVYSQCIGLAEQTGAEILLYPNPTDRLLKIKYSEKGRLQLSYPLYSILVKSLLTPIF